MKKYLIAILFSLVCNVTYSQVIEVSVATPGTLSNSIASSKKDLISSLKISGKLNGTDINFLSNMTLLSYLDIKDVDICSGGNSYYSYSQFYTYCLSCSPQNNVWVTEYLKTSDNIITDFLFYNFKTLKYLALPNTATSIGACALWGCSKLETLYIGNNVSQIDMSTDWNGKKSYGKYNFSTATGLSSIIVSDKNNYFTSIDGVLYNKNRTRLLYFPQAKSTVAIIPESINSIGDRAFGACSNVNTIFCLNAIPPSVGKDVFNSVNISQCKLCIPQASYSSYWIAGTWGDFINICKIRILELTKSSLIFPSDACEDSLDIVSDTTWIATSNQEWLKLSLNTANASSKVHISVSRNDSTQRTAKITVSAINAVPKEIIINQNSIVSGLDDIKSNCVRIFQEPNQKQLNISGLVQATLFFYDLTGRLKLECHALEGVPVSIGMLHRGLYCIRIVSNNAIYSSKIWIN